MLQLYAVELFQAFAKAMSQAVETNVADMARILATLFQIGPPELWGEPFHRSGLFALIVKTLMDDKVRVPAVLRVCDCSSHAPRRRGRPS